MFSTDFIINAISHLSHLSSFERSEFLRIHTDSRSIHPGDFFVPLKGDLFDGHGFISQALSKGAKGFLYSDAKFRPKDLSPDVLAIEVSDTLNSFRELAKAWRAQFAALPVIAIAGSVGKTTTKELIATCLKPKFPRLLQTAESQNGFVGVPLTLLALRPTHQVAVVEIGIDEPLAMKKHLDLVRPTISVVTALGPEHLETLKDLDTVAIEETEALRYCLTREGHRAILNLDEPLLLKHLAVPPTKASAITFSLDSTSSPWHELPHFSPKKDGLPQTLTLQTGPWKGESFSNPTHGIHNVRNLLATLATAYAAGLTPEETRKGLTSYLAPKGRSDLRRLKNGITVLADYYNSNPTSLTAALDTLSTLKAAKTVACLGDMLELGTDELRYHSEMAKHPLFQKAHTFLLFGPRMRSLYTTLKTQKKSTVHHFTDHQEMAKVLSPLLKADTAVLIKGSRGMKMETLFSLCPALAELTQK